MNLRATIHQVVADATDPSPSASMACPYCDTAAERSTKGPLYYWKCPKCRAFGTTWEWERKHAILAEFGVLCE